MKAVSEVTSVNEVTRIPRDGKQFAAVFFVVATVIIAPLTVIDTPLLADYPNHLARIDIIGNVGNDSLLAERYAIHFDLLPNIAMDLAVPWLAKGMPLAAAGRVFLALCLVSTMAGTAFLHRTLFNRWSSYSLLAAFFAYHGSMIAGMANFSLGIGLVPAALAVWIRMQHAQASRRLLAGSAMALALFFCHLVAAGAFGLLLAGYAVARGIDAAGRWQGLRLVAKELGLAGATGLLPLLLFLRLAVGDGSTGAGIVYGNAAWKLKALLSPLANYHLPLDVASFAVLAGLALVAWRSGWLTVDRRMAPGLVLLAAAFLLAPKALWTGGLFDQRLAVLLALMLVASTRVSLPKGIIAGLLPALLVLLLLARIGALTSAWLDHRTDLAEMRRAIDLLPAGARLLVVQPDAGAGQRQAPARHRVFHHAVQLTSLPALAVIDKAAFVSTLYALPGQQPLVLKPPFDRLGGRGHVGVPTLDELAHAHRPGGREAPVSPQIRAWTEDFDHVVMIYGYGPGARELTDGLPLEPLLDGDILDLFRIVKDGG